MKIIMDSTNFNQQIAELLYNKYVSELKSFPGVDLMDKSSFGVYINDEMKDLKCCLVVDDEKVVGVLLYSYYEDGEKGYCNIPLYGYGALLDEEKYVSMLFQKLADALKAKSKVKEILFSVNLYANDTKIQRLFSYMQFGFQAETCIKKIDVNTTNYKYKIKALSKNELEVNWKQVWKLTEAIVNHLKESPIFYPGEEFTEELYHEFFTDEDTVVYAAFNDASEIIGIIETNAENKPFVFFKDKSANVGEIYVLPQYRGSGLASELLYFAEESVNKQGVSNLWVEHGTANPNARGFWNKYFDTYTYEMIRTINI